MNLLFLLQISIQNLLYRLWEYDCLAIRNCLQNFRNGTGVISKDVRRSSWKKKTFCTWSMEFAVTDFLLSSKNTFNKDTCFGSLGAEELCLTMNSQIKKTGAGHSTLSRLTYWHCQYEIDIIAIKPSWEAWLANGQCTWLWIKWSMYEPWPGQCVCVLGQGSLF